MFHFRCIINVCLVLEGSALQEHRHKGKRKFRVDRDELRVASRHPHHHPPLADVRGTESTDQVDLVSYLTALHLCFPVLRMDMTSSADYQLILSKASFV